MLSLFILHVGDSSMLLFTKYIWPTLTCKLCTVFNNSLRIILDPSLEGNVTILKLTLWFLVTCTFAPSTYLYASVRLSFRTWIRSPTMVFWKVTPMTEKTPIFIFLNGNSTGAKPVFGPNSNPTDAAHQIWSRLTR